MDDEPEYRPGTQGGLCGCLVAGMVALPAALIFTAGTVMGDCPSGLSCHDNDHWALFVGYTVLAVLAGLLALAVRALYNWRMVRRHDPVAAGWPPVWALVVGLLLLLFFAQMAWELD